MTQSKALLEALSSDDPEKIKAIRGSQLSNLTRRLNALNRALIKQTTGSEYDLSRISDSEVRINIKEAKVSYSNICDLHERYLLKQGSKEEEIKYITDVDTKYFEVIKLEESYDNQLKAVSKSNAVIEEQAKLAEAFNSKKVEFNSSQEHYKCVAGLARQLLASTDADRHLSAKIQKDLVSDAFGKMDIAGREVIKLIPGVTPAPPAEDIEVFSCSKERLTHSQLLVNLEKLIREHGDSVSSGPVGPESMSGGPSQYLKLKKLEARHFSGQRREYAAWKRDFMDVVVAPGRPAAEIGFTLKSCIPIKYHYLFDNLSLSEHAEMLSILDNKFGKARLIVDETLAEMEKLKLVTNDLCR